MNAVASIGGLDGPSLIKLIENKGHPGILKPYRIPSGDSRVQDKCFIDVFNHFTGKVERQRIPYNVSTLDYQTWLEIDREVQRAAIAPMRAVNDLKQAGLVRTLPNGFAVAALMGQRASRIGTAQIGMDPQEGARMDRPVADTTMIPLPCIWSGFKFGARELAISKQGNMPLDTTCVSDSMDACARLTEQMLLGNASGKASAFTYAGGTIRGYLDHGSRVTFHITAPNSSGWTPETFLAEILAGTQDLIDIYRNGPYVMYMAPAWRVYMENDYVAANAGTTGTITMRERVLKVSEVQDIRYLYDLSGWDILLVQMDKQTVQEIIGMDWTTVQWESMGGQSLDWLILGIYVPQIRADYDGHLGVAHGSPNY